SHSVHQLVGSGMLQSLGLIVHAIPRVLKCSGEISLDHAMTTQRSERRASSKIGEGYSAIALVGKESLIGKASHHSAHRWRSEIQLLSDVVRRNRYASSPERVDRLQV